MHRLYDRLSIPADLLVLASACLIAASSLLAWVHVPQANGEMLSPTGLGQDGAGAVTSGRLMLFAACAQFVMLMLLATVCHGHRLLTAMAVVVLALAAVDTLFVGVSLYRAFHSMAAQGIPATAGPGLYALMAGGGIGAVGAALELLRLRAPQPEREA